MLVSEVIAVYSVICIKPEHILQVKCCLCLQGEKTWLGGATKTSDTYLRVPTKLTIVIAQQNLFFKLYLCIISETK